MTASKTQLERTDKKFSQEMRKIMQERFTKGLAKFNRRELSFSESTRLLMRTPSWNKVVQELKTLPKKESVV